MSSSDIDMSRVERCCFGLWSGLDMERYPGDTDMERTKERTNHVDLRRT